MTSSSAIPGKSEIVKNGIEDWEYRIRICVIDINHPEFCQERLYKQADLIEIDSEVKALLSENNVRT